MESSYKEYYYASLFMAILACIGSSVSIINLIPLLITFQFIEKANQYGMPQNLSKSILLIFKTAISLTILTTILYLSLKW